MFRNYAMSNMEVVWWSINRPAIIGKNFEIKSVMIQMIQGNLQFQGLMNEDPTKILSNF